MIILAAAVTLTCAPVATDGDSIRCGAERIRLVGIDAPEMGPCQPAGRVCAAGDPYASRDALAAAMKTGKLTITRLGKDRYGRTIADVQAGGVSLSCSQLAEGQAVYVAKWDNGQTLAGNCKIIVAKKRGH